MHYTDGIEFMKACIIMQRTERMAAQMDAKENRIPLGIEMPWGIRIIP